MVKLNSFAERRKDTKQGRTNRSATYTILDIVHELYRLQVKPYEVAQCLLISRKEAERILDFSKMPTREQAEKLKELLK